MPALDRCPIGNPRGNPPSPCRGVFTSSSTAGIRACPQELPTSLWAAPLLQAGTDPQPPTSLFARAPFPCIKLLVSTPLPSASPTAQPEASPASCTSLYEQDVQKMPLPENTCLSPTGAPSTQSWDLRKLPR